MRNNKSKILIYVPAEAYFLRELKSINFFKKIRKDFNTSLMLSKNFKNNFIGSYKVIKKNPKWRIILWNIYQALAAILFKRNYLTKKLYYTIYKFNMNIVKKNLFKMINLSTFLRLNSIIIFFIKIILKNTSNSEMVKINKARVIVLFGGHNNLEIFDLINIAKRKNIISILVMVNWDNATKPLLAKPDLVLTWGKQTETLAKKLNNVDAIGIGTPRFDLIKNKKFISKKKARKFIGLKQDFKYIIYAGKIIPSDDLKLLKRINIILNNKFINYKIIYRPHPFGINKINFLEFDQFKKINKLNNIIIDPTLKIFNKQDLNQYYYLFSSSDALISSFSTLTIEAAYYNLPTLCFAINDLLNEKRFDYENGCKLSPHLKILNKYNWPLRAFSYDEFFNKFDILIKQTKKKLGKTHSKILQEVVFNNNENYYVKLSNLIKNYN